MLKNKKAFIFASFILISVFCILVICFFSPNAVVKDAGNAELLCLRIYPHSDHEIAWFGSMDQESYDRAGIVKLSGVDGKVEEEILQYLTTCRECRMLEREGKPIMLDDVEMYIQVRIGKDSDNIKNIYFGTYNYSYTRQFGLKSEILNAEDVKIALKEILNFPL